MSVLDLIIIALATWRATHLIIEEEGPYSIFSRFRYWSGERFVNGQFEHHTRFSKGLNCFYCSSIWWATFFIGGYVLFERLIWIYLILAISAVAIMIEEALGD